MVSKNICIYKENNIPFFIKQGFINIMILLFKKYILIICEEKKYKIIYVIIYLLLFILVFARGINIGIEQTSFNDYRDKEIVDGYSGNVVFLIYNFIIFYTY